MRRLRFQLRPHLPLAACLIVLSACSKKSPSAQGTLSDVSGIVAVRVDSEGFHPDRIQVEQGQSLSLAFERTTDDTCATSVVFPELAIDRKLPLHEIVTIQIPTEQEQTLSFQCGMAMYKSAVRIHQAPK
jgi:plastocyanin domain-containing protein